MTSISVSCLCGRINTVCLTDGIPVQTIACHQTSCRQNLGALYHSLIPIKDRPEVSELTEYAADGMVKRYFCSSCGSHVFQQSDQWYVQSGVVERIHLEQVSGTLEEIAGHRYVEETLDGGIARLLKELDTTQSVGLVQHKPSEIEHIPNLAGVGNADQALAASCACGGIRFFLTRPNSDSMVCSSPWPDLIFPYHSHSGQNSEDQKWWVRDNNKWLAGLCACRSCRLGLSVPLQAWAFVAKTNLFQSDGSPLSYSMEKLRSFESSSGTRREFCGKCGATVFWHNLERPGVVDVSVGLLRAEGTLARSWLTWWTGRVSFAEDALDKNLISNVQSRLSLLEQSRTDGV